LWRHRPGVLQLSICLQHSIVSIVAHRLNRCVLRDGPTPHLPSSNGQRDALSAIHPLSEVAPTALSTPCNFRCRGGGL